MGRIFYAVAGEGRGHATRARAFVEAVRGRHDVTLFATGQALEILEPAYPDGSVAVHTLPGLSFSYDRFGRVAYLHTLANSLPFLRAMAGRVRELARMLERARPDLVVTDFEPLLARAAHQVGLPLVSIDHQRVLVDTDMSMLPAPLYAYAAAMAPFVRGFCDFQDESIVSSFFATKLKRARRPVTQVGVLLRPEVRRAERERGEHLVVYLRRDSAAAVVATLRAARIRAKIYGLGERPSSGRLSFHRVDPARFVEDLASSRALVTTAGNQIIGEAFHLHKPVLAVPEPGNREQQINGFFLARTGRGMTCEVRELDSSRLHVFLAREHEFATRIASIRADGCPATVARVELLLSGATRRPPCADYSPTQGRSFVRSEASGTIPAY